MHVISLTNKKGGSCKTTTAVFLGEALARMNQRVLVMDLDAQAHATAALTGSYDLEPRPMFLFDMSEEQLQTYIKPSNRQGIVLHVFPPDIHMDAMDIRALHWGFLQGYQLNQAGKKTSLETVLRKAYLDKVTWMRRALEYLTNRYDIILVDCPPFYNLTTLNAVLAANYLLVPLDTRGWSFLAARWVSVFRDQVKNTFNLAPPAILGYVICRYRQDWTHHQNIATWMEKEYNTLLFETRIQENKQCYEDAFYGRSPWASRQPRSLAVAADYDNLAVELLQRLPKSV